MTLFSSLERSNQDWLKAMFLVFEMPSLYALPLTSQIVSPSPSLRLYFSLIFCIPANFTLLYGCSKPLPYTLAQVSLFKLPDCLHSLVPSIYFFLITFPVLKGHSKVEKSLPYLVGRIQLILYFCVLFLECFLCQDPNFSPPDLHRIFHFCLVIHYVPPTLQEGCYMTQGSPKKQNQWENIKYKNWLM